MADPHRYQESLGKCVCGLDRWHEAHFNGDRAAAGAAFESHKRQVDEKASWQRTLAPGMSVMISEDHPANDLAGQVGQVMSRSKGEIEVKTPSRQVHVKIQWVCPVPLPEPPPRFASQEEADRWLEDAAREMGLKTDPDVPQFATQAEADEWLEAQQRLKTRDPYVPPTWRWDQQPNNGNVEWVMPDGTIRRATAAYAQHVQQLVGQQRTIQGQQPQLIVMDEAQEFDIVDPYRDDQ
jgi:hypothetical protein